MTIEDALDESGVRASTLTADEIRRLDEDGYVVLPAVYDDAMCIQLQAAFEAVAARERGDVTGKESGTRHPRDLLNPDPIFSVLVFNGHPWHSGTRNDSARSRRALQCVFLGQIVWGGTDSRNRVMISGCLRISAPDRNWQLRAERASLVNASHCRRVCSGQI
jgi:ectoine hydroxylase-related dioxygenase (phytanoyl-CoA dioxygenase family)